MCVVRISTECSTVDVVDVWSSIGWRWRWRWRWRRRRRQSRRRNDVSHPLLSPPLPSPCPFLPDLPVSLCAGWLAYDVAWYGAISPFVVRVIADQPRSRRYLMLVPICASSRGVCLGEIEWLEKTLPVGVEYVAPSSSSTTRMDEERRKLRRAAVSKAVTKLRVPMSSAARGVRELTIAAGTALDAGRGPHEQRENAQQYVPPTTSHTELNRRVEREMPFPPLLGFLSSRPFRPFWSALPLLFR